MARRARSATVRRVPPLFTIDDPADPRIGAYRDIRERDLVGRRGLFIAEGIVVLEKLVGSRDHAPLSLLIADTRVAALEGVWSRLPDTVPVFVGTREVIDAVAGFPLHRGVLAVGRRGADSGADALLRRVADRGSGSDVLLLCGIANHDNMGGIFRNAAAFGIGAVLLDAQCCDPLYRKAIRVSVGAALTVPFARLGRDEDARSLFDRHAISPIALSPSGAVPLADWRPDGRTAIVLGAEGPGLAPEVMAHMPTVRITMAPDFDSLNVATTSGIVLHHLTSRR